MVRALGVIPARFSSSRFPGKPLTPIAGKSMIQHVWERTRLAKQVDAVVIATDDERIERAWILYNLNPEPHKTVDQCRQLVADLAMDQTDFVIKSRFNTFIARFEREQTNVLDFGRELDFDTKINTIYDTLKTYININNSDNEEN